MKNIFTALTLALTVNISAQQTQSSIELTVGSKTFESIASRANELLFNPSLKRNVAFPFEMSFQDFGTIDSLNIRLNSFTAENETNKNVHINAVSFNQGLYSPTSSKAFMTSDVNAKMATIEYEVIYENENTGIMDTGRYQVIFNGNEQTVSYNYNVNSEFFNTEDEEFYVGISLETDFGQDVVWFLNLTGDPQSPGVAKTIEDFELLNALPQKNTLYTFSSLVTSVGEQEIIANSRLEKTENGYRLFSNKQNLRVELINTNGQVLSKAKNYGSNYHFISSPNNITSGIYFVKVSQEDGKFATYKIEF